MTRPRHDRLLAVIVALGLVAAVVVAAILASGPGDPARPGAGSSAPAGAGASVIRVIDGDTITVAVDLRSERVRYIGMDAPELGRPADGQPAECWAEEARTANAELVAGVEVILERDTSDRDRFGRLLRHVWLARDGEWTLVGEALVERGAAEARPYPPDTRHDRRLRDAEARARDAGAGMWGAC
jgi:micrococcal nuclease